ncbi:tetratricopeptide repeat protein [Promicromonospora sp. NPDC057138]|uniref:tetratricopeptide repeat protein n=1 Tax=Promicromonospora sp. NPDC057138 TaxID=3346031 RepID=UPI00363C42CB
MSRTGGAVDASARSHHDLGDLPTFDAWSRYQELAPVRAAVDSRDWDAAAAAFSALGPQELALALELVADESDAEQMLEAAVAAEPDDPLARTLLARRYERISWEIRTGTWAVDVVAEKFEEFREWLVRAEQILIDVCVDHPEHVPAWEARLLTARGLELGQSEARRRYDRLAALSPHHYRAQRAYLQQVVPKWGGSWDAAEAFVAECASDAPDGSPSRALLASLQIERWLGLRETLDDEALERLGEVARASVLHADHVPGPGADSVHAELALLYTFAERHDDAAPHFRALGDDPVSAGWDYLDDKAQWYARSRAQALGGPVPPPPGAPSERETRPAAVVLGFLLIVWILVMGVMTVLMIGVALGGDLRGVFAAVAFAAGAALGVALLVGLVRGPPPPGAPSLERGTGPGAVAVYVASLLFGVALTTLSLPDALEGDRGAAFAVVLFGAMAVFAAVCLARLLRAPGGRSNR